MMLFALDKLSCGWIVTGSEVIKLTICMVLFSVAVNLIRLQFACHQADAFIVPVSLHSKFARWCDRTQVGLGDGPVAKSLVTTSAPASSAT